MAVRNIAGQTILANVEKDSPSAALPASVTGVMIQLTDPNGVWATTPGNIKMWGVQRSTDNGASWNWGPVFQGDPVNQLRWIPFGTLGGKSGIAMPALNMDSTQLISLQGDLLRLAILTDANIVLGATLTTTP